jgi:transglutaminase-like putative cysteine protease
MAWMGRHFEHEAGAAAPAASLDGLFGTRSGSAADLAHLLISIVRGWSMPARFVTGYIDAAYFEPDDDDPDAAPRPQALHCWMEALIPGGGWRGFDPVQGLLADASYIRLAVGRDAGDVTGFRQTFKGDGELESLTTTVRVERLD